MKRSGHTFRRLLIPLALGLVSVAWMDVGVPSTVQAEEGKIDVTITDKGYSVTPRRRIPHAWGGDKDYPSQQGDDDARIQLTDSEGYFGSHGR